MSNTRLDNGANDRLNASLPDYSALATIRRMSEGSLSSETLTRGCLAHISQTDANLGAWAHVSEHSAIQQAMAADDRRLNNRALGELHGMPVGLKDIIDTADAPTSRGTPIYVNRQPAENAAVVEKLLEAGAVVLGKTVTTEFAWMHQSHTRNAVNEKYSPGGSSSGSAAAVAAGQVPLALGTQTGGSVIRPAAYNGVFGLKPSRGLISRRGVLQTSPTLDQIGVFGTYAADVCALVDVLSGFDRFDALTRATPAPRLLEGYHAEVPANPALVWIDMPYADRYSATLNAGIDELCTAIINETAAEIDRIPAPRSFAALPGCHQIIYDMEILQSLDNEWKQHRDLLSETAVQGLQRAQTRTQDEYQEALGILSAANDWFDTFFHDYDGILTPSAPDIAPLYGQGTGDPVCCVVWTLCGLPCLSMPLLIGDNEMPLGIQLVGAYNRDDRLMRTARWLLDALGNTKG